MIFAGKSQDEEDRLVAACQGRRDRAGVRDCRRQPEVGALPQNRLLAAAFLLRGIKMVDEIGSSVLTMFRSWSSRSASSKPFATVSSAAGEPAARALEQHTTLYNAAKRFPTCEKEREGAREAPNHTTALMGSISGLSVRACYPFLVQEEPPSRSRPD
jgi:hypothetical protein